MPKVIGFEATEIIAIGLPNVTRCDTCGSLINYLGVVPNLCSTCGENMTRIPGTTFSDTDPVPPAVLEYSDFQKIEFRAGTVKTAERVPKSDKLIKMTVGFGSFERQIVAGVGLTFQPEDLVGKQILFVVNLGPKKMMGVESHGMMLAAGEDLAKLTLITLTGAVEDGTTAH